MAADVPAEPRAGPLSISSWLLSTIIHAALIVILGLAIKAEPRGVAADETGREVGVVIKELAPGGEDRYAGDPNADKAVPPGVAAALQQTIEQPSPIDISAALPKAKEIIGIGGPAPGASSMTTGPKRGVNLTPGFARTRVYGLLGEGFKFIYVFDHSASMGGPGFTPLQAAKQELLASLNNLGPTHQFQIIFYNERPTIFDLAGHPNRLVFGTEQNKERATFFVQGIKADGGTDHEAALDMALNLAPDVIYFLTDADQPAMSPSQLARIRRRNAGASINCIEFGQGPQFGDENFLMKIASQNGGAYTYIDVTKGFNR